MNKTVLTLLAALLVAFPIPAQAQVPNHAKNEIQTPNQTVYISTDAPYYHRMGCAYLKKGRTMPIMLYDACKLYQPCPSCNPPICDQ